MSAIYCPVMERKIGTETCELRRKNLVQFPYCKDCKDYKTRNDIPRNLPNNETTNVNTANSDLIKEDLNSKFNKTNNKPCIPPNTDPVNIDETLETLAVKEENEKYRICKVCGKRLECITDNFSLAGPNKTMLWTCKSCVSNARIKTVENKKLNKINDKTTITDLQKEIKYNKIKPEINAVLPNDVLINKIVKDNKLSLNIEYGDLSIMISLTK
jgi:hypothetical protein